MAPGSDARARRAVFTVRPALPSDPGPLTLLRSELGMEDVAMADGLVGWGARADKA